MYIEVIEQQSPLLGRQKVHDERSRAFPLPVRAVDRSRWRDKALRLYEPRVNPNQTVGCCTGVAKCNQFNAVGNRRKGVVLDMKDAENIYSRNTQIDPWEGQWPPDDTGSSGLASCKTAQEFGLGGEYRWIFSGADAVVQAVMDGRVISVGTWWYWDMFRSGSTPQRPLLPLGGRAGGHQYVIRGYDKTHDAVLGRCWWGGFKDFWLYRQDLDTLLMDDGDAHWQQRLGWS